MPAPAPGLLLPVESVLAGGRTVDMQNLGGWVTVRFDVQHRVNIYGSLFIRCVPRVYSLLKRDVYGVGVVPSP